VRLVKLTSLTIYHEAEIARARLESEGIFAVVFDHFANQYIGWGRTLGVRLMVDADDYEAARAILISTGEI
jgi:hypothetical protein